MPAAGVSNLRYEGRRGRVVTGLIPDRMPLLRRSLEVPHGPREREYVVRLYAEPERRRPQEHVVLPIRCLQPATGSRAAMGAPQL